MIYLQTSFIYDYIVWFLSSVVVVWQVTDNHLELKKKKDK